jgi:hypothetical protein
MRIITFRVPEHENEVISFYENAFRNGGMQPDTWGRVTDDPKVLNYSETVGARSPSVYFLDLITNPIDGNRTEVEIGVCMFPGY